MLITLIMLCSCATYANYVDSANGNFLLNKLC